MQNGTLLAAVDLGSNSFRLEIGRYHAGRIERVEYLKETVRQGAGLDDDRNLSPQALERGWACLARFGDRLRGFPPRQVRALATQTLREAGNRETFLARGRELLGYPIEVVSGLEEARLIYLGVTRLLPPSDERRLVVDIGGRSTELILGRGHDAHRMESCHVGSVSWSTRFFADGAFRPEAFRDAEAAARAVLGQVQALFPREAWDLAYGSSGTVGAVADALQANGRPAGVVTREGLDWLYQCLLQAGNAATLSLDGIKADRRPVIGGGVSVLRAVFDVFGLERIHPTAGALRHGALFELAAGAPD